MQQPGQRLHITPLNPQILPLVLSGPYLAKASNISFHSIQTFPEKDYGYVELPPMDADKLKKKLNGSILKGSKMRVEEARPKKTMGVDDTKMENIAEEGSSKKKKPQRREEGVLPSHELDARKVKRGWTEPSSGSKPSRGLKEKQLKKSKPQSITGQAECLFKAKLPPNVAVAETTENGKVKKRKRGDPSHDILVHEFTNNTKHSSFIRDESDARSKKPATEYVQGKGWVDEDGILIEEERKRRRSKAKDDGEELTKSASRRSSRLEGSGSQVKAPPHLSVNGAVADDETSSSGTSGADSASDSEQSLRSSSESAGQDIGRDHEVELDRVERLSITRSSATPPPSKEPPPTSAPSASEVHPLEALFKRPNTAASHTPKKPNLEVSTSFSFFDPDGEENGNAGLVVPQTPFTQQDIRQRRQRSAAPTPDTAAPGKTFGNLWEGTSDISADEDDAKTGIKGQDDEKSATPEIKEDIPESGFVKEFWENRGENNRAWKRRRREAAKRERQKGNKERRL